MPFAKRSSLIAGLLQHRCDVRARRWDQRFGISGQHTFTEIRSPAIATGQKRIASRRANRMGRVGIRESHPFAGQGVDCGRANLSIRLIAADVAPTKIVREDHDDVGLVGGGGRAANFTSSVTPTTTTTQKRFCRSRIEKCKMLWARRTKFDPSYPAFKSVTWLDLSSSICPQP